MKSLLLKVLLIVAATGLCTGQKQPSAAQPNSHLDKQVQGLEERLGNLQFEIDQLKKELLARDEQIHALTEMIEGEGDPNAGADSQQQQQGDDTFQVETDACQLTRFVHFSHRAHQRGKAYQVPVTTFD